MIRVYTLRTFLSSLFLMSVVSLVSAGTFDLTDGEYAEISCGDAIAGSNIGGESNYIAADYACYNGMEMYDGIDSVFKLTLDEAGTVSLFLSNQTAANFDMFLFDNQVVDSVDCPGVCFASGIDAGSDLIEEDLEAGVYWVIVDIADSEVEGDFVLSLQCEGVYDTISCGQAIVESTVGRQSMYDGSEYAGCNDGSPVYESGDKTFLLSLDQEEELEIRLTSDLGGLMQLFLVEKNMDGTLGSCLAIGTASDGEFVISETLAIGEYYVIVDGIGFSQFNFYNEDEFRLEIDCGKTFIDAQVGQSYNNSNAGLISHFDENDYGDCIDGPTDLFSYDAGDVLYRLELTEGFEVMLSLTSAEKNLDLILMDNVVIDGEDCPGNCLAFINQTDVDSVDQVLLPLDSAGIYWIIVDGESNDVDGVTEYNEGAFTLEIMGTSLPIQLTRFEAIPGSKEINLEWTTASEINSEKFVVQRSEDASFWTDLTEIGAQGFSEEINDYQHTDFQPMIGENYYRLKMMDLDGSFEYSNVVNVPFGKDGELRVYPSITSNLITVDFGGKTPGDFQIFDTYGKLWRTVEAKDQRSEIDLSQLTSGMYFLHFTDQAQVVPVVKQ